MSRSSLVMIGLVLFAVLGGPAIFYGLIAMGEAGVFDGGLDNFWLIAGGGIGFVVFLWIAILLVGSHAIEAETNTDLDRDQLDG